MPGTPDTLRFYEREANEAPFYDIPAYQYPSGMFNLLDALRPFLWSGYCWRAIPVPRAYLVPVAASGQVEDACRVPAGSYLLGLSSFSAQAAGFRFFIYDVGADAPAIDIGAWDNDTTGAQANADSDAHLHILPRAYCVVSPGRLLVKVVNMATVANDMQLLLHFAVPVEGDKK